MVLFFDEFDKLYRVNNEVLLSCLETLRSIRTNKDIYAIQSIIAIGPFSILHLNAPVKNTSPFNVKEPFMNPNFTLKQVQTIYKQFAEENYIIINDDIVQDIYIQTNR